MTETAVKAKLSQLLALKVVQPNEVQVYYYLKVLHTTLPKHLCSSLADAQLGAMAEHVESELNKLDMNETDDEKESGG
jgi:hypothetical protein